MRSPTIKLGFAIAAIGACIVAASRPVSGAPVPKTPARWMQAIERPHRGWDYDGNRILGYVDNKVCLWDATTGKVLDKWRTHKEHIFTVQFSPDGDRVLTCWWMGPGPISYKSKDTRTIIWSLKPGFDMVVLYDQVAGEFSPDGKRVVTFTARPGELSSFDATVWEVKPKREIIKVVLDKYADPEWDALHFSPDGRTFALVKHGAFRPYNDCEVVLYDAKDSGEIGRSGRKDGGHRFTSTGALASFGGEAAVLTDATSGKELASVKHGLKSAWGALWTHDGKRVAALPTDESEIKILDISSGKIAVGAKCGPYPLASAMVSPDSNTLAIEWGGANKVEPGLGLYDMITGKEIARIKLAEWGHIIGFAPDSKTFLVGGSEFVIYDAETGKKIRALKLLDDVSFEHDWHR